MIMTPDQKNALRENLLGKSVRELIEMLIQAQEEVEEAKQIRRRFVQIQNLLKDPDQRRKPGRPSKDCI
jgi:hypothetical protein